MKKLILSFLLGVGFGALGYASANSGNITQTFNTQKNQEVKKQKAEKYDFSLFKFVKPSKTEQKDSIEVKPILRREEKINAENSAYYENLRDLFKFS